MCRNYMSGILAITMAVSLCSAPVRAQVKPGEETTNNDPAKAVACYLLNQFGSLVTPASANEAFAKASESILAAGGGLVLIPTNAPAGWMPRNTGQHTAGSAGLTVVDLRGGTPKLLPPQASGLEISRIMDLPDGESLSTWGVYPMVHLNNVVAHGSTSYRDFIQEEVKAGKAQRFYMPTIRGIFPGMFLNAEGAKGCPRLYVQFLGYDREKALWYFVADTDADVPRHSVVSNKNHVNALKIDTYSHTENEGADLMLWRHNYSQGDNYLVDARFKYMGDVHSTAGDENGVIYAAFVESETTPFHGEVETWDPGNGLLKCKNSMNRNTLGTGRPVINMNPAKWVTAGRVWIVRPASWIQDSSKLANAVFRGQSYPTTGARDAAGNQTLRIGGVIRFSAEAPVTKEAVGRYFAVDEPGELVPGSSYSETEKGKEVLRWYLIDSMTRNADGTKDIRIVRHWSGAVSAGSPTLYKESNYSADGREKPLRYIIAPGANVYDVSGAVELPKDMLTGGAPQALKLSPTPFKGSAADFAPGDRIVQAIGADPAKPVPFRSVLNDKVPGAFPAPVIDIANNGLARHAVMEVRGDKGDLAECSTRYDESPAWENYFLFSSACRDGIVFDADTAESAIQFSQPHGRAQPMVWRYGEGREAKLTVSPLDGTMTFAGNGISVQGGLTSVGGLSGTTNQAMNLRGIAVPVKAGAKELQVVFPQPESDARYAVFVQLSWLSRQAVPEQTEKGFTVKFETPPAKPAFLHWLLVR